MIETEVAARWQMIRAELLGTLQGSCDGEIDAVLMTAGRRAVLISIMPDPRKTYAVILDVSRITADTDIPGLAREFLYELRLARGKA